MPLNANAESSSYSAYGVSVKENQALYNQYLGAYKDVLSGVQGVGNAQRQALTDFYAQKQGASDQSLISRGLGNTTVLDSANRGLTLDEGKAQNDLAEKVARMRADYGSQMAQGIHGFMGGYSESQSHSQRPMMQGGGFMPQGRGFQTSFAPTPLRDTSFAGGGGFYGGGTVMGPSGPLSVDVPQGGFTGSVNANVGIDGSSYLGGGFGGGVSAGLGGADYGPGGVGDLYGGGFTGGASAGAGVGLGVNDQQQDGWY